MIHVRRFLQSRGRTAKPQSWTVWKVGNTVFSSWGQVDGALQETQQSFEALNVGKANEKSRERVAEEWMDRQILLRTRRGYVEVTEHGTEVQPASGAGSIVQGDEINFRRLPQNLRFYKPEHHLNAKLEKKIERGEALFLRKRNGNMYVVTFDENAEPHMFSSTSAACPKDEPNTPWLDRFPNLEIEISNLGMPPHSILLGELVSSQEDDDLDYVGSVLRAKTAKAIETQDENRHLCFAVWDVAFHGGEQLLGNVPVGNRLEIANGYLLEDGVPKFELVIPIEQEVFQSKEQALKVAKERGWEGWVVIDPNSTYADRSLSFHGKAERPSDCAKLKPKFSSDFILRWDPDNGVGTRGKGKKSIGVGSFFAYLIDDEGKEVFISKVGGGLTDDDVAKYAVPGLVIVGEVEYASVTKTGSIEFPEFVREREDKRPEECSLSQLVINM